MLKKLLRGTCFFTVVVHAFTKSQSLNKQDIQKNCVPEFPILSNQKLPSCVLLYVFTIDMNMYKEISKHSWKKKSCSCFGQLTTSCYLFPKKCWIWNWTWYCLWSLHRYIRHSFLNFTADLMNNLQFKQMVNLTVLVYNILRFFFIFLWEDKFLT